MLRRMMSDQAPDPSADGVAAAAARPRGGALFSVPRLFVGFAAKHVPDGESSRSPTSPLDPKALLLRSPRSPRSWDSERVGLGLVDALAGDSKNCLLGPRVRPGSPQGLKSYGSLPKPCGHSHPELGKARSCSAADTAAGGMSVPSSRFFHGDLKSGPETIRPGGSSVRSNGDGNLRSLSMFSASGSLPVSIGGPRRCIGSVSASEIEQSEDYTRVISRGANPKTTHIFGDCILEPHKVSGLDNKGEDDNGGAESYWVVKCAAEAGEGFLSFCFSCKKKLEGNDIYIYRGEKAFCSANCRDQEILVEEEAENNMAGSPGSACSSFHDDIFMSGMVVTT